MPSRPGPRYRRSLRLRGYDYRQAGAYFVTICAQGGECIFGDVVDPEVRLNQAGQMVQAVWGELPRSCPGIDLDAYVIMPNHLHGIVVLTAPAEPSIPSHTSPLAEPRVDAVAEGRAGDGAALAGRGQARGPAPTSPQPLSLPDVVQRFKSLTTARYRAAVRERGWPPFPRRLWQRNYYEHIIRSAAALERIRRYIEANPVNWPSDEENPVVRPIPNRRR